jgi:hypothetical protein
MGSSIGRLLIFKLSKDLFNFGAAVCAHFGNKMIASPESRAMPPNLTPLEDVSQLSPRVRRLLGKP